MDVQRGTTYLSCQRQGKRLDKIGQISSRMRAVWGKGEKSRLRRFGVNPRGRPPAWRAKQQGGKAARGGRRQAG